MRISIRITRRMLSEQVKHVLMLVFLVLFLFPIFWVMLTAFKTRTDVFARPPVFFFTPTLQNFRDVLSPDSAFPRSLMNSMIAATFSSFFSLLLGVPAAYALSRFEIKGKGDILFWILSTRMLPPIGMAVPLFLIVFQLGYIDKVIALVVLYTAFNLSFTVWMMKGFFDDLPVEIEESALIDGCTPLNTLWLIGIPLSRAALATTLIFSFIFSWNEFLIAFILTRASAKTVPLAILEGVGWLGIRWEYMSAGAVLAMIPPLVLAFLARRQLASGLTLGAVK